MLQTGPACGAHGAISRSEPATAPQGPWYVLDLIVDGYFYVDIVLNCITGYYSKGGALVMDLHKIIARSSPSALPPNSQAPVTVCHLRSCCMTSSAPRVPYPMHPPVSPTHVQPAVGCTQRLPAATGQPPAVTSNRRWLLAKITWKRGCQIKRRCGRCIPPLFGVVCVAYTKVWYRTSDPL